VKTHEGMTDFGEAGRIADGRVRVGRHFRSGAVFLCDRAGRNKPVSLRRLHFKMQTR
jgi:hypothetical protein